MGGDYESREMIWDRRVGRRGVDCIDGCEGLGGMVVKGRLYIPAMTARNKRGCHTDVTCGTGCRSTMKSIKKSLVCCLYFCVVYGSSQMALIAQQKEFSGLQLQERLEASPISRPPCAPSKFSQALQSTPASTQAILILSQIGLEIRA